MVIGGPQAETARRGPRNVIAIIILVSDAITVLLLLKPDSEPSDGVQQPQAVLWEGLASTSQGPVTNCERCTGVGP